MRFFKVVLGITLLFSVSCGYAQDSEDDYKLSSEDRVTITVFDEPDLSIVDVKIGANGVISMPLLGQVPITDLTITEVEQKLTELFLNGFLKKPQVSVTITEYRPFYVNGQVQSPGSYSFRKGVTVEKAITLAGGFTERAAKNDILLVPEKSKQASRKVKLNDLVKPGDVITVNESFF